MLFSAQFLVGFYLGKSQSLMSVECHSVFLCQPKFGVEDAFSRIPVLRREVQGKQAADWGETLDGAK